MMEKIAKQAVLTFLIALALFISKNSHINVLEKGADTVLGYIDNDYTVEDMNAAAEKSKDMAASVTAKVGETVSVMAGKSRYGEPIDDEFEGDTTSVYAVGGGEVASVGENEEIGKYVRIIHGDSAESLYGNLKSVEVSVPARVKKGQIIGVYEKDEKREFYYSFRELD